MGPEGAISAYSGWFHKRLTRTWGVSALIWTNALVGWAVVTVIYRFGGLRLYRQVRPAFLGLFVGNMTSLLVSNGIRLIAGLPGQAA